MFKRTTCADSTLLTFHTDLTYENIFLIISDLVNSHSWMLDSYLLNKTYTNQINKSIKMVTTRSMAKRKQIKNNITKRSTKKIKTKECFIRINRLTVEEILKCTAPMKSTAKTQQEKKIENTTPASSSVLPVIVNKKAVVRKTTTTTISKSSVQSPVFFMEIRKKGTWKCRHTY